MITQIPESGFIDFAAMGYDMNRDVNAPVTGPQLLEVCENLLTSPAGFYLRSSLQKAGFIIYSCTVDCRRVSGIGYQRIQRTTTGKFNVAQI
jgi:hypothetical protein